MKNPIFLFLFICFSMTINAQDIYGSWTSTNINENGVEIKSVLIITKSYHVMTSYVVDTGKFLSTKGGSWNMDGNRLIETIEFHTENPELVGTDQSFEVKIEENSFQIPIMEMNFKRIDDGSPGDLNGAWLMSARVKNGEQQTRDTSLPRKTMKILSGTRFQWIAYNTETKKFMATGGGTYTTINGKYTETIDFFSKDNSKVGISLKFDYELDNSNWHHKGFSSKGDPIDETWTMRN
jgi:hypothetical protein